MINGISPDDWWRKKFQFFDLVNLLKTTIGPNSNSPHFKSLTAAKELKITANHFGMTNCTASKVTFAVCIASCSVLGPLYLPVVPDQKMKIVILMVRISQSRLHLKIHKTATTIRFKLFVIITVYFWMQNAHGQEVCMMQKYLSILGLTENYKILSCQKLANVFCLA